MDMSITEKARGRLDSMELGADTFLRIAVVNGGCAGMTYDATIDTEMSDGDEVILEDRGLRVVSDPRSTLFLDGLEIDYSDDLITAGFQLRNSNSKSSCGCGASFSV